MVSAIRQHESPTGMHVFLLLTVPEPLSHLPPHPIPLGCPRAGTLSALRGALSSHWSPVFYTR